jgi:hypothetical protein
VGFYLSATLFCAWMAFAGFLARFIYSRWILDRVFVPFIIVASIFSSLEALVTAPSFFSGLSFMFRKIFELSSFFLPPIGSMYLGMLYAEYKMRDDEKDLQA